MAYTITYRKAPHNRFKRVHRKNWEGVVSWIQNNGDGCSMVHIRNLDETGEVWV